MSKSDTYRAKLASLSDWDAFLLQESGLPGPRANLELVKVAAEMSSEVQVQHWLTFKANTPEEYLALCGTVGLGGWIALGKRKYIKTLRACASDSRWRIREGVAMALQQWGDEDFGAVLDELETWREGNLYEQRAIAAAVCEPRLLRATTKNAAANLKRVLKLLDSITRDFSKNKNRKADDFIALKKGLAYCWSVAVAASPDDGQRAMEKWFGSDDADVQAVMRENLNKDRLKRMDAAWVAHWSA